MTDIGIEPIVFRVTGMSISRSGNTFCEKFCISRIYHGRVRNRTSKLLINRLRLFGITSRQLLFPSHLNDIPQNQNVRQLVWHLYVDIATQRTIETQL